ncbi:hypothetical protein PG984_007524 [Apiospora sp. TS-2023a]
MQIKLLQEYQKFQGVYLEELKDWVETYAFPESGDGLDFVTHAKFIPEYMPRARAYLRAHRVAVPRTDFLCGYSLASARNNFTEVRTLACRGLDPSMGRVSSPGGTVFPFFIAEIAAEGPEGGPGLLNTFVQERGGEEAPQVDNAVFSVAANQFTAELLVSYMDDQSRRYSTRRVASFLLCDPEHVLKFHRCIRNILD